MPKKTKIERVQTGIRIEKRMLKGLKALAEYLDLTLGDLIEGMILHAFDSKTPFSEKTIKKIREIKQIYELNLDAGDSHSLTEK